MNNVISETTGTSPFFANYGFHPRLGTEPSDPHARRTYPTLRRDSSIRPMRSPTALDESSPS